MSRARNNNVRGPTSALTEFLRESGITPTTIARRAASRQQAEEQQPEQPEEGLSSFSADEQEPAEASTSRPSRASSRQSTRRRTSGYASDNLDEDEDDEEAKEKESTPPPKKRKLTKAAEAKLKAAEKKKAGKGKESDDEDDPYTSLSKSMWSGASKPPVGNFEKCAKCKKQFTVTKYTIAANPPPGWLCHVCAKAGGADPFKKPAPKKRKAPGDKREVVHFVENRLPSLVNICIRLLTQYIDDVESLGDIGALNVEAIAKAMAKNRSLTPDNARLFYNTTNERLTFFDATNLTPSAFGTLVYLNPNLTSLRLDFCGQLDDAAFKLFATHLPALKRIELLGPFLVRVPAWKEFLTGHRGRLEGFLIHQSPRFDLDCMQTLVQCCPNLKELRLKEVGKLTDAFLEEICELTSLEYLDISAPAESCSDTAILGLLEAVGKSLKHLDVSKHIYLTDAFLNQGLLQYCTNLEGLGIAHLPEVTDRALASFFEEWANPPLITLDASRNPDLHTASLRAIMNHSRETLEELNINGWKDVEEEGLREIGKGSELKKLDVGFCRNVDDFVVKGWLDGEDGKGRGVPNLKELKVWGCNRVTSLCPRRGGLAVHGVESHIIRRV